MNKMFDDLHLSLIEKNTLNCLIELQKNNSLLKKLIELIEKRKQ